MNQYTLIREDGSYGIRSRLTGDIVLTGETLTVADRVLACLNDRLDADYDSEACEVATQILRTETMDL